MFAGVGFLNAAKSKKPVFRSSAASLGVGLGVLNMFLSIETFCRDAPYGGGTFGGG